MTGVLEIEGPAPAVILAGRDNSILRTVVLLGASLAGTVALGGANSIFVAANSVARRLLDSIKISVVAGVTSDHGEAVGPGAGLEVSHQIIDSGGRSAINSSVRRIRDLGKLLLLLLYSSVRLFDQRLHRGWRRRWPVAGGGGLGEGEGKVWQWKGNKSMINAN